MDSRDLDANRSLLRVFVDLLRHHEGADPHTSKRSPGRIFSGPQLTLSATTHPMTLATASPCPKAVVLIRGLAAHGRAYRR